VAASKLNRPVFVQNERSDDMQMSTGREVCNYKYTVTFDPSGRVDTMDATMLNASGWFMGDAVGDGNMGLGWSDDCYSYRKFKIGQKPILTDVSHCTSCRAPGAMNAGVFAQSVMEHIAKTIGKSTEEVQEMNFYKIGDKTPFGDEIGKEGFNFTVPQMWKKLQADTKYVARKAAVKEYNAKNRWTKRGIALSPVKYIADVYGTYVEDALISIYGDGSVLISHAGSEIGQGINTKAALAAASTLAIPLEKVRVGPKDSSKNPNASATGGSGTSETVCAAVITACETLKERLKPYSVDKGMAWEDAVSAALADQVCLMTMAEQNWVKKGSNAHPYATYGVAASEVLIDVLTGEVRVERVDILMDLGTQLDAATDLGQLQGGFVMALGWMMSEELRWDANGTQLNLGTWEYKIPTAYDIPVQFNVSLLKGVPNQSPTAVKGSKLQSEPVMALVSSVMLAVKEALYAARKQNGLGEDWFKMDLPLTPEAVRKYSGASLQNFCIPRA
jgi:xanthine dehydrogenase/oxidase